MREALVDTDILSFFFRGEKKVVERFNEYLNEFEQINISIITYEILGGLQFKNAEKQLRDFKIFISNNSIIHISEESAQISSTVYADLRRSGMTIGTSDILAGIALENGLALITNNEKHFNTIHGLKTANWRN